MGIEDSDWDGRGEGEPENRSREPSEGQRRTSGTGGVKGEREEVRGGGGEICRKNIFFPSPLSSRSLIARLLLLRLPSATFVT